MTDPRERLDALRRAFDASFAEPPPSVDARRERVRLVLVRVGGERHALRIDELAELHVDRTIVPLPGGARGFLGLAGVRGRAVAVYDLAALLDAAPGTRRGRQLLVARAAEPVAFAIDERDRYLEVEPGAILRGAAGRAHVEEYARVDDEVIPVVDLRSILRAIASAVGPLHPGALP